MSPDPFVHLHVASGYSLRYGASHPHALVERAAEQEMDTLALTDRDGTYGAVKFAKACLAAGIRPVLGVDLAYRAPTLGGRAVAATVETRPRTPVRGGAYLDDPRLPRVTLLANAGGDGGGRAGWAAICRLVSATHLAGERGSPVADLDLLAPHLAGGDVLVLLGPASGLGAAATRRRDDLALAALAPWRELVPRENLLVELVSHRLPGRGGEWGPGSSAHAARMAGVARQAGLGAVLTNAVRYADRLDAPTVDVLDAARRLVALDRRHVDRGNAEGFLKSGKQMHEVAEEICRLAGLSPTLPATPVSSWPAPARWPTGVPSTRGPTSGWGRCTSRSSQRSGRVDEAEQRRRRGALGNSRRLGGLRSSGTAARRGSAGATARRRSSGSGSGSTTSWR